MFVGRSEELAVLRKRLNGSGFELGVVYGQRRIGKTSLILEAVKGFRHLYFLSREDSYQNNLAYFSREYRAFTKLPFVPAFDSFDELFDAAIESAGNEKLALVIDELPFLAKAYPGIVSYLQGLADRLKREGKDIKLILSGSDMSFMIDLLEDRGKPLYQRSTFKIHVGPMVFSDAIRMLDGVSGLEKAKYLSIFGNRPYYLDKIDKGKTFEENLLSLCFNRDSILIDAPNITLPLGYSGNSTYISILTALSSGKRKVKEIADSLKMENNALSTFLARMMEGGSIERKTMFNGNQKSNYYEISDPFIRFYYRVIYPSLPDIESGIGASVKEECEPIINDMIAHGFENTAISYLEERNQKGLLPGVYHPFRRYVVDNSALGRSIEIDALSDSLDGKHLFVMEAKFKEKSVSKAVLDHLKEGVSIFASHYSKIHYCLFSKTSFSKDILQLKDPSLVLITLDEMMAVE